MGVEIRKHRKEFAAIGQVDIDADSSRGGKKKMGNKYKTMKLLIEALLDGDQEKAIAVTRKLCNDGVTSERIVTEGIEPAMMQLDTKCTAEEYNLLEIMLAGRAVMGVVKELYPLGNIPPQNKGTVIIASMEGDVHDLGKNIVKMVLTGAGYHIVDCGKNCPLKNVIDNAEKENARAICISGLVTTVIPQVKRIKGELEKRGLGHIKVLAGGAALKQLSSENLNTDFVGDTAFDGTHYLDKLEKKGGGDE